MSLLFTLSYDGQDFHGWQIQPGKSTIQGALERALADATGISARTVAASRTDRGVHARGQRVAWHTEDCRVPVARLPAVINRRLPRAIRILDAVEAAPAFDPRRAARAKTYSYTICSERGRSPDPFADGRVWMVAGPLSLALLNDASRLFLGSHDFRAFRGEGSSARTTVRTIYAAHWLSLGPYWRFMVTGDGFLYHMVRFLVGSMIEAAHTDSLEAIRAALQDPCGSKAGVPAPARGLCLERVEL